jgi:predicted ATPase
MGYWMELVYLWIEDYKNIHRQGFNFSPRFECTFHDEYNDDGTLKDDCVLDIKLKEHIENFFGENINVTAIVGENGSGKSTVCNSLIGSQKGIIRVYSLGREFYYFESKVKAIYPEYLKKIDLENIAQVKFSYDFFSQPFINDASSYYYSDFIWSVKDIFNDIFNSSYENIDLVKYKSIVGKAIYQYGKDIATLSEFRYENIKFTLRLYNYFDIEKRERLNESIKISTSFGNSSFEDIFKDLSICKKFLSYIIYLINEEKILSGEPDWLSNFNNFEEMLDNHNYYLELTDNSDIKILIVNYDEYCRFLALFDSLEKNLKDSDLLLDELLFSRNFYPLLELNYYDKLEKLYDTLSHGERQIHSFMLLLYDKIMNSDKTNFEIILDEIETNLHPKWQKSLVLELIKLSNAFKKNKNIHFIITSHSPFILSDIPKENVIFLEKGKQVYPFNDSEQTFGANIHTLLSHGFFMKDGLMGEFAKEKITKILRFLNNENKYIDCPIENIKPIIEMIGEDFLRNKLLNLYYKKFTNDEKERKKEILKQQIDNLQKQYAELNL